MRSLIYSCIVLVFFACQTQEQNPDFKTVFRLENLGHFFAGITGYHARHSLVYELKQSFSTENQLWLGLNHDFRPTYPILTHWDIRVIQLILFVCCFWWGGGTCCHCERWDAIHNDEVFKNTGLPRRPKAPRNDVRGISPWDVSPKPCRVIKRTGDE